MFGRYVNIIASLSHLGSKMLKFLYRGLSKWQDYVFRCQTKHIRQLKAQIASLEEEEKRIIS